MMYECFLWQIYINPFSTATNNIGQCKVVKSTSAKNIGRGEYRIALNLNNGLVQLMLLGCIRRVKSTLP
mgnify:CR=1 FL=1